MQDKVLDQTREYVTIANTQIPCAYVTLTFFLATYRVSKKTWTFFEIGIIPLFIKASFQNYVWLEQNDSSLLWGRVYKNSTSTGSDVTMTSNYLWHYLVFIRTVENINEITRENN